MFVGELFEPLLLLVLELELEKEVCDRGMFSNWLAMNGDGAIVCGGFAALVEGSPSILSAVESCSEEFVVPN